MNNITLTVIGYIQNNIIFFLGGWLLHELYVRISAFFIKRKMAQQMEMLMGLRDHLKKEIEEDEKKLNDSEE